MIKELENKIAQLQYEISCLGLDKEELTGVNVRTEELKTLVKNIEVIRCSTQFPSEEEIYVSQSNDGSDDVYCAFTDHTRGLKDCEEAGTLLTRITLYRD